MARIVTIPRTSSENSLDNIGKQCPPHGQSPLSKLTGTSRFTVCKVSGDRKLCARMGALGIFPGASGELICPADGGQCILRIHGSNLCLDNTITDNIFVTKN